MGKRTGSAVGMARVPTPAILARLVPLPSGTHFWRMGLLAR